MKVVLLAGGFGSRITEESQYRPKPMVELGGMPILWHIMKEYSYYGFNDFIYDNMPSYCRSRWITEIAKFPRFQERVKHYWQKFYTEVYPAMDDFMEEFTAKIEEAGNCDHRRWPQYSSDNITARMRSFAKPSFHMKVEWLQTQWNTRQLFDNVLEN